MSRNSSLVCITGVLTIVVVTFLSMPSAFPDPGSVIWSGGTLRLMKEHPSVRLVSEKIVDIPKSAIHEMTSWSRIQRMLGSPWILRLRTAGKRRRP